MGPGYKGHQLQSLPDTVEQAAQAQLPLCLGTCLCNTAGIALALDVVGHGSLLSL